MSHDWKSTANSTARKAADFTQARLTEIGDAWGSVKERFPAEANIALGAAALFTIFNYSQGGGLMRSLGRGIVSLATMLGLAVAAKAIADDDNPDRGGWDLFKRDGNKSKHTANENMGQPLDPFKPGTFTEPEQKANVELSRLPEHAAVRISGTNTPTPVKHIEREGPYDLLVFQGRPTSSQFAQIVASDPSDRVDWDVKPKEFAEGEIGSLSPKAPYAESNNKTYVLLKDEAIRGG